MSDGPRAVQVVQRRPKGSGARGLAAAKLLFDELDRARTFGLAAEMAFWLFLSLIPLAAVAGLAVAKLAVKDSVAIAPLMAALPTGTRALVQTELGRVSAWNGGAVAPVAALTFVWLASSGVHSIFDALELEVASRPRPWWKKRLLAVATCVALSIGVAGLALLGTGVDWIRHLAHDTVPFTGGAGTRAVGSAFGWTLRVAFGAVIAVALMGGLYWIALPPHARRHVPLLPGAALAVLMQAILALGYGLYVRQVGDGGAYQAGLAVIGVTLMGLYLFSVAVLAGSELNRLIGCGKIALRWGHRHAVLAEVTRRYALVFLDPRDARPRPFRRLPRAWARFRSRDRCDLARRRARPRPEPS